MCKAFSKYKRQKIYRKTDKRCAYCGRRVFETVPDSSPVRLTIDHIKPKVKGGTNHIQNLILACRECNQLKGDMKLRTFRKLLSPSRIYFNAI